ncbi:carbohydrate kinase family protein [Streptomyces sp. V2I9]|uniref:carbohydrate kinase family protein n=1 Tax=Streptomyces sp. V2I9 TaxID=3042304 RepID=UPI0027895B1B|nr:carbohydrate kinase family protein [Streptomyces sp. V2I9]MDQ0982822.1 sugar/nucleoside kinase (ribokinase family) [Streptomyces sp. V2I9]
MASRPAEAAVLIVGAYAVDLVLTDLRGPVRAGAEVWADGLDMVPGGAFTLAMGLHRLGRRAVWAADFGTDLFSRAVLAAARQEGMEEAGFRHHPRPVRNVTVALSDAKDRAMIAHEDPVAARPPAELIDAFRPSVVMLPFLRYGPDTTDALKTAARHGTRVFMDCQDYPGHIGMDDVRETLGRVDVFAPNESEALRVTGAGTVEEALALLCELVPTVVIKRGPAGAVAAANGRRAVQGSPAVPVVDTTGAGDCFNVGFVHRWIDGSPLADCLAAGVACGAAAVTGPGSGNALGASELPAWLTRLPY